MPTSKFSVFSKIYDPKDNDYVCLLFSDAKKSCFSKKILAKRLHKYATNTFLKNQGQHRLVFVGKLGEEHLVIKQARLDKKDSTLSQEAKNTISAALKEASSMGCKRVVVPVSGSFEAILLSVQEGAMLGGYVFDKYKKKPAKMPAVVLVTDAGKPQIKKVSAQKITYDYTNFARDILNEPPNVIYPESLAGLFKEKGLEAGLSITVWNEAKLKKERCRGIVSVGQGAASKSKLVIGRYSPPKPVCHLALVGKGITFDTGGYCLKPASGQEDMKMDMGGAAMMFGAACAIAKQRLPIKLSVYLPLAENDISSAAYHTSDILTMRNNLTVQVDNTDAEGRLILADALTLACEETPDYVIDSATLTGACVVGLGEDITGVYGTDKTFTKQLLAAGEKTGEYLWELPLHAPYKTQLNTALADCKNVGSRWGGSITAALFLKQFVNENTKWIHMDIAGPGTKMAPLNHLGKGAKGFGVKTIVSLADSFCAKGK